MPATNLPCTSPGPRGFRQAGPLLASFVSLFCFDAAEAQTSALPEGAAPTATTSGVAAANPPNVILYLPDFFKDLRPTSALDMIQRLPGFSYDEGSNDVRGFNGSAGNVLINGERPASKSIPLDDILKRIPVAAVLRIELIRGGAPGIDMQGQTVVANIIRSSAASSSLSLEAMTKLYTDHRPGTNFRAEASRRNGDLSLDGAIQLRREKEQGNSGKGRIARRTGAGALIAEGPFESDWERTLVQGNGGAEYGFGSNTLRLSLGGQIEWQDRADLSTFTTPAATTFRERIVNDYRSYQVEGGADLEHEFSDAVSARILGLRTQTGDRQQVLSENPSSLQLANENNIQDETILRSTLTWEIRRGLTIEAGAEGALNQLDAARTLRRGGVPVVLPSANVLIREQRAEGFANLRWTLTPALSFDGSFRYETSTIEQSGDANLSRTLSYPKPRASLTWDVARSLQLRGRIERTIGQLDFTDFAATASLDTGSANAGNPNLMPERAWVVEVAAERRFWAKGVFVLSFSRAWVRDVADLIPVAGFDAPGNIGNGRRDEFKASLSVPGDRFGISGAMLRMNGTWSTSRVRDPATLLYRRISRQQPFDGDLLLSKDFPALRSVVGIEGEYGFREISNRIREIRTDRRGSELKAYWDWTARPGLIVRFQVENILARRRSRERVLYGAPRTATALPTSTEQRYARLPPFLMMRVRKTF